MLLGHKVPLSGRRPLTSLGPTFHASQATFSESIFANNKHLHIQLKGRFRIPTARTRFRELSFTEANGRQSAAWSTPGLFTTMHQAINSCAVEVAARASFSWCKGLLLLLLLLLLRSSRCLGAGYRAQRTRQHRT